VIPGKGPAGTFGQTLGRLREAAGATTPAAASAPRALPAAGSLYIDDLKIRLLGGGGAYYRNRVTTGRVGRGMGA
jgi:hypothetical protein